MAFNIFSRSQSREAEEREQEFALATYEHFARNHNKRPLEIIRPAEQFNLEQLGEGAVFDVRVSGYYGELTARYVTGPARNGTPTLFLVEPRYKDPSMAIGFMRERQPTEDDITYELTRVEAGHSFAVSNAVEGLETLHKNTVKAL